MAKSHFSLTWEKFHSTLSAGFGLLQQNGEFVDLTLAADGHMVKVHQLVLGIASPYIKELIQSANCKHPIIFMNNVSYTVLENILEYVYTGEVSIEENNLTPFLNAAKTLQIRGLDGVESSSKLSDNVNESESAILVPENGFFVVNSLKNETVDIRNTTEDNDEVEQPEQDDDYSMNDDDISFRSISPVEHNDCNYKIEVLHSDTAKLTEEIQLPSTAKNVKLKLKRQSSTSGRAGRYKRKSLTKRSNLPKSIKESIGQSEFVGELTEVSNNNGNKTAAKAVLNYTVSERGSVQLILNRYIYNLISRRPTPMKSWRCVDNRHLNCPAAVLTQNNLVIQRAHLHNHPFHDKRIQQKITKKAVYSALQQAEKSSIEQNKEK